MLDLKCYNILKNYFFDKNRERRYKSAISSFAYILKCSKRKVLTVFRLINQRIEEVQCEIVKVLRISN